MAVADSAKICFYCIGLFFAFLSCKEGVSYLPELPGHFPKITIPPDNQLSTARIAMGRKLFFDPNISLDSTVACVNCHLPKYALADTLPKSLGVYGRSGLRNAPSLYNAAFLDLINKDGGVTKLDLQALVPIEDENEMAMPVMKLHQRLLTDSTYVSLARDAYDREPDAYSISRALASFVRTLYSADSPYDRFIAGDSSALSDQAQHGLALFNSDRLNCAACHSGPLQTANEFANNGLYETYQDYGRGLITMDSTDRGKFRIPSLRNVAVTAPYMHDGSLANLSAVIDHYENVSSKKAPLKSPELRSFQLTASERTALVAFLHALTGEESRSTKL